MLLIHNLERRHFIFTVAVLARVEWVLAEVLSAELGNLMDSPLRTPSGAVLLREEHISATPAKLCMRALM